MSHFTVRIRRDEQCVRFDLRIAYLGYTAVTGGFGLRCLVLSSHRGRSDIYKSRLDFNRQESPLNAYHCKKRNERYFPYRFTSSGIERAKLM